MKFGRGLLFALACAFSPCCTPIIVPIALALLAGSPLALWMGANLGWVYGLLTAVSVVSLALALRLSKRTSRSAAERDVVRYTQASQ